MIGAFENCKWDSLADIPWSSWEDCLSLFYCPSLFPNDLAAHTVLYINVIILKKG
jgi:hypothetical protein